MHRIIFFALFLVSTFCGFTQTITAKIVDKQKDPIPFATIQTGATSGVISNEEGIFTIDLKNSTVKNLSISCMGFATKEVGIKSLQQLNFVIVLEEAVNQLGEVYLYNKTPNADSIISKAIANISKNYNFKNTKHNLFYRNKTGFNFEDLKFEITKASGFRKKKLISANGSLDSMANVIINSKSVHYIDALGDLYIHSKDSSKLQLDKVVMLLDKKNNFSLESAQDKAQVIVFKYLDIDKSYKVKTGLFKIEDSLTFDDVKKKENKKKDSIHIQDLRNGSMRLFNRSNLSINSTLRKFLDTELYDYTYKDAVYFNNELIHIIDFHPDRGKAKYTGTLYIVNNSYAVTKADYTFAKGKRGQKFNLRLLLGVKFIDNHRKGTFIFHKKDSIYVPKYITQEEGQYVYMHRPIKFIENGTGSKVAFDILIEGNTRSKTEVLINEVEHLDPEIFESIKELKQIKYERLDRYNPDIWKDYNVLEPLEEMKNFKVIE